MVSLRERNRRNTLALTQRTAVELFVERGFDDVKVTDIADAVGMAPSTLYRHFPTKESIVLWDEHEDEYEPDLLRAFDGRTPWAALRHAFVEGMAGRYDADTEFQLQRVSLVYEIPSVYAAAAEADRQTRADLAELVEAHLGRRNRDAATLVAGAALLAVDGAMERWQASGGRTPLGDLVADAFDRLAYLGELE